jgi:hypothetical protein
VIEENISPTPTIEPTPTEKPSDSPTNQNKPKPTHTPTASTFSTQTPSPTATTTVSPVQTPDPNIFSFQSNSTVSGFSFDSTNQELRFNVTGSTGTTGCTNITIAKSFLTNVDNLKVYLDGTPIDCNISSSDTLWMLMFTYHHSSHQVKISLSTDGAPRDFTLTGIILAVIIVCVLLAALGAIVYRKKHLTQKSN